jgi:hypothetical protein
LGEKAGLSIFAAALRLRAGLSFGLPPEGGKTSAQIQYWDGVLYEASVRRAKAP